MFNHLIQYAEYLVTQDETELALMALELLPAYYRDNKPEEVEALKEQILSKMILPVELSADDREMPKSDAQSVFFTDATARGQALAKYVKEANDRGSVPHIIEYGPGDFCFPIAMHLVGLKFKYKPIGFHLNSIESVKAKLGDKFQTDVSQTDEIFFVAYEIIEHLADVSEIRQVSDRQGRRPAKVFLSTPKYCFGKGTVEWREVGIHHRRAYTPQEFYRECLELFPRRKWSFVDNEVMVMVGE